SALATELTLPPASYQTGAARSQFFSTFLRSLDADARIAAAGLADPVPLSGVVWSGTIGVEGLAIAPGAPLPHVEYYRISSGYFRALRVPFIAGRDFDQHDDAQAQPVVVVDEAFAARYWSRETAVGKRVDLGGPGMPIWATVVGVAGRVHRDGPRHLGE